MYLSVSGNDYVLAVACLIEVATKTGFNVHSNSNYMYAFNFCPLKQPSFIHNSVQWFAFFFRYALKTVTKR